MDLTSKDELMAAGWIKDQIGRCLSVGTNVDLGTRLSVLTAQRDTHTKNWGWMGKPLIQIQVLKENCSVRVVFPFRHTVVWNIQPVQCWDNVTMQTLFHSLTVSTLTAFPPPHAHNSDHLQRKDELGQNTREFKKPAHRSLNHIYGF